MARTKPPKKTTASKSTGRAAPSARPPRRPAVEAESAPADPSAPAGAEAAYQRYLPEAMSLPEREVVPFRLDIALANTNAQRGVEAVRAGLPSVRAQLPTVTEASLDRVIALGLAVSFAAGRVERFTAAGGVPALVRRAFQLRAVLLASAEALAAAGLLSAAAVAKIRAGRGPLDTAGDCIALVALFNKHPGARSKTPLSAADLKEAAEVGATLLAVLQPRAAKKSTSRDLADAIAERDRLFTLFQRAWEEDVWRVGAWLFGRAVDEHVPSLYARAGKKRPKADADKSGEG